MKLVIGDKNWSTWTLRPWLVLRRAGFQFEEAQVRLRRDTTHADIARFSPSGWIPALIVDDEVIWDSVAICEYLAELRSGLWPSDRLARAHARAVVGEMHSGFAALRAGCPMDLRLRTEKTLEGEALRDARRVVGLWRETRKRWGAAGPFLFGAWSIADAFYTPMATRFRTYALPFAALGDDGSAETYAQVLLATPEFLEWEAASFADEGAP